jgi:hypothetical protein
MSQGPRRHCLIPDTQTRPGAPTDHLAWIGEYIAAKRPDVIVHLGDHYDLPSLNSHEQPGSAPVEGKRYKDDIEAGRFAWDVLTGPIEREIEKRRLAHRRRWEPERHVTLGNHEARADRAASNNPKLIGTIGSQDCTFGTWKVHPFLDRVFIDQICYSHFFQNTHSNFPIGGTIENRLARIGCSFAQGHEQGTRYGIKIMGSGRTIQGIVAGSCYLHVEDYRGAQGQRHKRGIVMCNEVEDGEYDIMPVSLRYLCRHYENMPLDRYMRLKYPNGDWSHLA